MEFDLSVQKERSTCQKRLSEIFSLLDNPIDHDLTKRHVSSQIDLMLGFKVKHIEEILQAKAKQIAPDEQFNQWGPALHDGAQTWIGLDFQILQTTYHDLKILFDTIGPVSGQRIVDLGAGYGRLGIFLHHFYPRTEFLGLELVKERVNEGNRLLSNLNSYGKKMVACDLSKISELPEGDIYFIYDFGSLEHIKSILEMLKDTPKKMLVVKGRIARQLMLKDDFYGEGIKVKRIEDVYIY